MRGILSYAKIQSVNEKCYYVYIMTNISGTIYVGITNDLPRRVWEHKQNLVEGFTKKYRIKKLIYYEETPDVMSAIAREKELKGWRRSKKTALITENNPDWRDLAEDFMEVEG